MFVPHQGGSVVSVSDSWPGGFWVPFPVEANFLSGVFSPLTSAEACEKSSPWLWKENCVSTGVRKPGNICVTDHHDMTLAVKVTLNPNTTTIKMRTFKDETLKWCHWSWSLYRFRYYYKVTYDKMRKEEKMTGLEPKILVTWHCSKAFEGGWGVNPFPNKPWFLRVCWTILWKHCGKRRNCS